MVDAVIFGADKVRLLNLIECDKIEFVNEANELSKFECVSCHKLALYNHTAACDHIYCGKCHGQTLGKPCGVEACKKTINVAQLNMQLDCDIAKLKAFCAFKAGGCSEEIALHDYLTNEAIRKLTEENNNLQERQTKMEKQLLEMQNDKNLKEEVRKIMERLDKKQQPVITASDMEKQKTEMQNFKSELRRAIDDKITDLIERQAIKWNDQKLLIEKIEKDHKDMAKIQEGQNIKSNNQKEMIEKLKTDLQKEMAKVQEGQNIKSNNQMEMIEKLKTDLQKEMAKVQEGQNIKSNNQKEMNEKLKSDLQKEMAKVQETVVRSEEKILQVVDKKFTAQMKTIEVQETTATEFQWTISGIRQILTDWNSGKMREILSDSFTTKALGYILQCKLVYHANQNAFSIMIKCDRNSSKPSAAIYLHQRTVSILDQSGGKHIVRIDTPGFGNKQAQEWMSGFRNDSWPIDVGLISNKYIKNDAIVAKILIEPLSIVYKSIISKNGTLTWKISDYTQKKQDYLNGVTRCFRSPYFYTSGKGYRVHVGLHVRSWDVSFYLSFNRGEFDESLPSTFVHKASLIIIAQSGRSCDENLTHVQKSTDTNSNLIAMISTTQFENNVFLKDGSLLINVIVE